MSNTDTFELDFEAEAEGGDSLRKSVEKIQKIKAELEACKKERQEYLDGWQRLRADVANQKKESTQLFEKASLNAKESILEDFLPTLDAFDMAMQGEGWNEVSASWRSGVEYIHTQFLQTLEGHGITAFGIAGDPFNTQEHEAVQEMKEEGKSGVILSVRRKGYKLNGRIIRPAQVIVAA